MPGLTNAEEPARAKVFRVWKHVLTEDLSVDPHPSTATVIPVFGDPVVQALTWLKVCREATADTGWDPAVAQQRTTDHLKVTARSNHSFVRLPGNAQRRLIHRQQRQDQPSRGAYLVFREALGRHSSCLGVDWLNYQTMYGLTNLDGIGLDRLEHSGTNPSEGRQRARHHVVDDAAHSFRSTS